MDSIVQSRCRFYKIGKIPTAHESAHHAGLTSVRKIGFHSGFAGEYADPLLGAEVHRETLCGFCIS